MTSLHRYTHIAEHRGSYRVWLEGKSFGEAGFEYGQKLSVTQKESSLECRVIHGEPAKGERVISISRRKKKVASGVIEYPLLEIRGQELADQFGVNGAVHIDASNGRIVISETKASEKQKERESRFIREVQKGRISSGSYFNGGMLLHTALSDGIEAATGFSVTTNHISELEPIYMNTCIRNMDAKKRRAIKQIHLGPIQDIDVNKLPQASIVSAGIPCTGGTPGKTKLGLTHAEDHPEAGGMSYFLIKACEVVNPAMLILENVSSYLDTPSFALIRAVMKHLNYDTFTTVLNARDHGSIESRVRMCAVFVSSGLTNQSEFSFDGLQPYSENTFKLSDLLESVPLDSEKWKDITYLHDKFERDKANGKGFTLELHGPESTKLPTIGRLYSKYRSNEPLVPHPTEPNKARLLTPTEHAAVKRVPEYLIANCSNTRAQEILGQGCDFGSFYSVGNLIGSWINTFAPQSSLTLH